jgi:hypothetical protein
VLFLQAFVFAPPANALGLTTSADARLGIGGCVPTLAAVPGGDRVRRVAKATGRDRSRRASAADV